MFYSIYDAIVHISAKNFLICVDLIQIIELAIGKRIHQEVL